MDAFVRGIVVILLFFVLFVCACGYALAGDIVLPESFLQIDSSVVHTLSSAPQKSSMSRSDQFSALFAYAAIDYSQSVSMFFHRKGFHEINPIIGKHPSRKDMLLFGLAGFATIYVVSSLMPEAWGRVLMDSALASEQFNIEDNRRIVNGWAESGPPVRGRAFNGVPIVITFRF